MPKDDIKNIVNALEKIKHDREIDDLEKSSIVKLADKFISCSLKDPRTRDIVKAVNVHHHTKTCRKYSCECRFYFPRYPSLRTIVAVPARIYYSSPEERDKAVEESKEVLAKVK